MKTHFFHEFHDGSLHRPLFFPTKTLLFNNTMAMKKRTMKKADVARSRGAGFRSKDVLKMRGMRKDGASLSEIAEKFHTSKSAVSAIVPKSSGSAPWPSGPWQLIGLSLARSSSIRACVRCALKEGFRFVTEAASRKGMCDCGFHSLALWASKLLLC